MDFDEILSDQRKAPTDHIPVEILCRRPALGEREFPDHIELDPVEGVIGDRWKTINWVQKEDGSSDERNQISILPSRIYRQICLQSEGKMHPGDTIIADLETSFENWPIGSAIRIGEAVLEVSDVPNYGCEKWRDRYGMEAWKFIAHKDWQSLRLRGFLCRIKKGGRIFVGDKLMKCEKLP